MRSGISMLVVIAAVGCQDIEPPAELEVAEVEAQVAAATFYVDAIYGNNTNDGRTPTTALKTLEHVNTRSFPPGSFVRFRRGQTWRGRLRPSSDGAVGAPITFSSYGDAALPKPSLLGSTDCSAVAKWKPVPGVPNVWQFADVLTGRGGAGDFVDVGNLFLRGGAAMGIKKWDLASLTSQDDFWFDYNGFYPPSSTLRLYMYSVVNPATRHGSIECALNNDIVDLSGRRHIVVERLSIKYGSANGVLAQNAQYLTIQDMDVSYVGGGLLYWIQAPCCTPLRYGNGIQFWSNVQHVLVQRNRVWEIYDTGITNQSTDPTSLHADIIYRNNLVWNTAFASYELWGGTLTDIVVEHNTSWGAGRGWGQQRPDRKGWFLLLGGVATASRVTIRNNAFSDATGVGVLVDDVDKWRAGTIMNYNDWHIATPGDNRFVVVRPQTRGYNDLEAWSSATGWDRNSLLVDPRFVSLPGNPRLRSDSPLIDRGMSVPTGTDFYRNPRPRGAGPDLGAAESPY